MSALVVIPVLHNADLSLRAIYSALNQSVSPTVLVVDQGSTPDVVAQLEACAIKEPRVRLWLHHPPFPSLGATWNRALHYAWACGHEDALVINNDVELPMEYYRHLRLRLDNPTGDELFFLSGIGVRVGQSTAVTDEEVLSTEFQLHPDFSAYLITHACHGKYPFDERFIPAYCEDVDYHRRLLLGDDGQRIGKINVPFIHHSSATLKSLTPEQNARLSQQITNGSRAYYEKKWGPLQQETRVEPFGPNMSCSVTMDTLRAIAAAGDSVQQYVHRWSDDGENRSTQPEPGLGEAQAHP